MSANPAFCQQLGYSEAQLRRLDLRAVSHPEDFITELKLIQQMCCSNLTQQTMKKRFLRADGSLLQAEVTLSLVGNPDDPDSYLLCFVTDLSDRQRIEQDLRQQQEREALLNEIAGVIRTTLDLPSILKIATERLQGALAVDRVIAYQILPDQSGICAAEALNPAYFSMLGQQFSAECIPPPYLEAYRLGRCWSMMDIETEQLADCHREVLRQMHVRSMIATTIQRADEMLEPHKRTLWGLLVVHSCRIPRHWTQDEQQLVQAVANQIAIAIEQASLLQQLKTYAQELEDRVHQRTLSLERSLQFEQLIRRLTETLLKALDEDQVLGAAVEGVVQTLGVDGCYASLFDEHQNLLEVRYEHFTRALGFRGSVVGQLLPLQDWSEADYQRLLAGETVVQQILIQPRADVSQVISTAASLAARDQANGLGLDNVTQVVSPIVDDQGLIGALSVFVTQSRYFDPAEIKLIEQVANQCAIAIRQARLYRQEHQQRISADYFRLFLEKSTDIFVEYDRELRYISINPAGSMLLNRQSSEIIGRTNCELMGSAADAIEPLIRQAFYTCEPVFINHEIGLPTGTKSFETIYTPIPDPNGVVQRVIGVCRDISEARRQWQLLENQNHQLAETTRLKEEFIANTSHELRTPLTAILGFSNVLLQEFFGALNAKQKDYVDRIHSSGQHLLELINDILDLSRLEADRLDLDPQQVFIADIYESILSLIGERAAAQGLSLEVDIEPDLEFVVADSRRLRQMLLNLLTNAVKFTLEGTVGLKIYRSLRDRDGQSIPMINFLVWDTGIGIQTADQHLLFSPFSQIDSSLSRNHQGSGLGLAITRKLAELHGGFVEMESNYGQGSRFTLSLPLYQSPQDLLDRLNQAD